MNENWHDRHVLPYVIDMLCGLRPIREQREKVVPLAYGRVLEVGIGTGHNMPYYRKSGVTKIVAVDPALHMHHLAQQRINRAGLDVELIGLSVEKLPLADASFDSILMTYTLCSIAEPIAALEEMRRVLAPGGRLLFCEHGRAPMNPFAAGNPDCSPLGAASRAVASLAETFLRFSNRLALSSKSCSLATSRDLSHSRTTFGVRL
jgi:SAM-dependent methyltransferase